MLSLDDLSNMAILSFKNGLRLHFDSSILLKEKSFPSCVILSVLSMEEFGKYFSLSAYVFYTGINDTRDLKYEEDYLKSLYNHINKQMVIFGRDGFAPYSDGIEKVKNRFYERIKQKSAYVGFQRNGKNLLYEKGFENPFDVSEDTAKEQFNFINNSLIEMIENFKKGIIMMDEEEINDLLNDELLNKLISTKNISDK